MEEALVDDEVTLVCEVKDIPEGGSVKVAVWEYDEDNEHDHVADLTGAVKNGKVEIPWKVIYMEDNDDSTSAKELAEKGCTLPEYHFTAEYQDIKSNQSPVMKVMGWIKRQLIYSNTTETIVSMNYILEFANGKQITGKTDTDGYIDKRDIPIGELKIKFLIRSML